MDCPAPERLVELVEGSVSDVERSALEVHIDSCDDCRVGLASIVRSDAPPRTLGRFRIDGVLGAGGMGVVYRAHDPALGRAVAVKVVHPGHEEADLGARLEREARALGRLSHPNVCHVYDVGRDEDEVWIAMELVDGATLRAWLAAGATRAAIFGVLEGAGRGLAAAHDAGLVHRDVKPENVLVDRSGRAVVTDFGLARPLDGNRATQTSVLAGTPAYMAPEVLEGAPADARSDQYAFGVMAHEALAGGRPKPRGVASPELPPPLRAVLARALSDDPAARWPSLPALVDALAATRETRRRRWPLVATLAGSAALVGVGVTLFLARHDEQVEPIAPPPPQTPVVEVAGDVATPPDADQIAAAAPDAGAPRTKPHPRLVASAPPDAAPDAPPMAPNLAPRFGQLAPHKGRAQDLDRLEQYIAQDCDLPSSLPKPSSGLSLLDWGKVTRGPVDVVATIDTGAQRDMVLYEVAGARATYVFDARGANIAGQIDAKVGDLVALCPERAPNRWQLPGDWSGTRVTTVRFAAHVAAPPDLANLPYVSPARISSSAKKHEWPYPERFITYVHDPRLTSDGKYVVRDWYFEIDANHAPLPRGFNSLMIVDRVRFEDRDGRTVVIVHGIDFRAHMFPR